MNILGTYDFTEMQKEELRTTFPEEYFVFNGSPTPEQIMKADILIGNIAIPDLKKYGKNLKWIQLRSAGAEKYAAEGVLSPDTVLTCASGGYGLAISEYMVGILLAHYRKLSQYMRAQERCEWVPIHTPDRLIYGTTTLCIGLGDIGTSFCQKMHAFGSYTIGVKNSLSEKPYGVDELYLKTEINKLLPKADIVALTLPGTQDTYHIIDEKRLALMKKDAVIINIGRGTCIDTDALVRVLQKGDIAGALLDVVELEPLPPEHPLWRLDNVILTPHISGGVLIKETGNRIYRIILHNLKAFLNGEPLVNLVDRNAGYCYGLRYQEKD